MGVTFWGPGRGSTTYSPQTFSTFEVGDRYPDYLGDIEEFNAALRENCDCPTPTAKNIPLQVCVQKEIGTTYLFSSRYLQQLFPAKIIEGGCVYYPVESEQQGVYFHVFDDSLLEQQIGSTSGDPTGNHVKPDPRDVKNADMTQRGWQAVYGDQPGYRRGRQITFERGRISRCLLSPNIFQDIELNIFEATDTSGEKLTFLTGCSGYYIADLTIECEATKDSVGKRLYFVFKYGVSSSKTCTPDGYRNDKIIDQEDIIDNLEIPSQGKLFIDTRYNTADIIEIRGYAVKIKKAVAKVITTSTYMSNILASNAFSSAFDNRGRLFVFYEDDINYTELPYLDIKCQKPQLPSSSSSGPVVPPSTSGSIPITGGGEGNTSAPNSGIGDGGNEEDVTLQTPPPLSTISLTDKTVPPPRGLAAVLSSNSDGNGIVKLTWEMPIGASFLVSKETKQVTFTVEWSATSDGTFIELAKDIGSLSYSHIVGEDAENAQEGQRNYYRVYTVYVQAEKDAAQQVSAPSTTSIFLLLPAPCKDRDCAGCFSSKGTKSKNSYSVIFSIPSPQQLSFSCAACGSGVAFLRILEDAFYEPILSTFEIGNNTTFDEKVPKRFCLPMVCDDVTKECRWENTFFVPALTRWCVDFTCVSGFRRILVPMTISLRQTASGWFLEAYVIGPGCWRLDIFKMTSPSGTRCEPPERFIHDAASVKSAYEGDDCAVYPPREYYFHTGTISCAMSPDMGVTWFEYKGVVRINNDRKAVKPVIVHDEKSDDFHLFYVERDFFNEKNINILRAESLGYGAEMGWTGRVARLLHTKFNAQWFQEVDSFIPFWPAPTLGVGGEEETNLDPPYTDAGPNAYHKNALTLFSDNGKMVRLAKKTQIVYEEYIYKNGQETNISLPVERNSAYIDQRGKLFYTRFKQAGTLVDPPSRLTRRRRKVAKCGTYTWTVSGISDADCKCQALNGSFRLELNSKTAVYADEKWTMTVSSDYNYWVISSIDGMLTFRRKRDITQCPPTGSYTLVCSRCSGEIVGTLDVEKVSISGKNAAGIDNGTVSTSVANGTNYSDVTVGQTSVHDFVVTNNRPSVLKFTGTPKISITGPDAGDFSVSTDLPSSVDAYAYTTFSITFSPHDVGTRTATVKIENDSADSPYLFVVNGNGVNSDPKQNAVVSQISGTVFSANAIGTLYTSDNEGQSWQPTTNDFKAGQWANLCYDQINDTVYCVYIVDDMLFSRRYPNISWLYKPQFAETSDMEPAWDGINIIVPPELVVPKIDVFQFGTIYTLAQLSLLPALFLLPIERTSGEVIDTVEQDLISKKTTLKQEKDSGGLPIYLVGNREGVLINAFYPYPSSYIFNDTTAVAQSQPAAHITRTGNMRFFYVDSYGGINGGILTAELPNIDIKRKSI